MAMHLWLFLVAHFYFYQPPPFLVHPLFVNPVNHPKEKRPEQNSVDPHATERSPHADVVDIALAALFKGLLGINQHWRIGHNIKERFLPEAGANCRAISWVSEVLFWKLRRWVKLLYSMVCRMPWQLLNYAVFPGSRPSDRRPHPPSIVRVNALTNTLYNPI